MEEEQLWVLKQKNTNPFSLNLKEFDYGIYINNQEKSPWNKIAINLNFN